MINQCVQNVGGGDARDLFPRVKKNLGLSKQKKHFLTNQKRLLEGVWKTTSRVLPASLGNLQKQSTVQ